jgi:hypothetical protein
MPFDSKIKVNSYNITIFCVLLTAVVYVFYAKIQPAYTYSLTDPRLDAHQYLAQYDYFKGTTKNYAVRFPFNARILSSWLAAQLPFGNSTTNFKVLNGIFLVLMALFLGLLWQRLQIRNSLIIIGLCWLLFHWKGPVRMYLPDPITADVGGYFFAALWLWLLSGTFFKMCNYPIKSTLSMCHKRIKWKADDTDLNRFFNVIKKCCSVSNYVLLCVVAALATLQKEVFIVIVGSLVIGQCSMVLKKYRQHIKAEAHSFLLSIKIASFILAIACVTHLVADYFYGASNPDWRNFSVVSVLRGLQRYLLSPALFLHLPVSWFLAFGGFLIVGFLIGGFLLVLNKKKTISSVSHHTCYITVVFFILSIFAGGDTSRILMTGAPFVMTFLLIELNQMPAWVGYFVALSSLPLMRMTELEPDLGLYPAQAHNWCVECWSLAESWPYWAYMLAIGLVFWFLMPKILNLHDSK